MLKQHLRSRRGLPSIKQAGRSEDDGETTKDSMKSSRAAANESLVDSSVLLSLGWAQCGAVVPTGRRIQKGGHASSYLAMGNA